jgi:hypothetical protein
VAAASGYIGRIPAQIFPTVSQQEIYCALYKGKGSENNLLMNGIIQISIGNKIIISRCGKG